MRIPPQPIEVQHDDTWYPGTLHSWDVDDQGNASGIASFTDERSEVCVGRFPEERIRHTASTPQTGRR